MKKIVSLITAVMLCFSLSMPAYAATFTLGIVQPYFDMANTATSTLTVNGTTATCASYVAGGTNVTSITAVQTLEKQGVLWLWSTYDSTTWTKTVNSNKLTMSNTKSGLESGNYRLKTVFTLTNSQGKSETITVYSDEKAV